MPASSPTASSSCAARPSRAPTAAATISGSSAIRSRRPPSNRSGSTIRCRPPPAGYTADGKTLYWIDSRDRDTAALIAQDVATGKRTVVGNARGRHRRHPRRSAHRPGDGLFGQLSAHRMDPARCRGRARLAFLEASSRANRRHVAHHGRRQMDRRGRSGHRALVDLAVRPQGADADQVLHLAPGARGHAARRDAPGRDQVARRADAAVLPHASAGQRSASDGSPIARCRW